MMDNTTPNPIDIQNTIDNFEAVIKSGDVKLVAQNEEIKLYLGEGGLQYIYDGSQAYSASSDEFARMKEQYFGQ